MVNPIPNFVKSVWSKWNIRIVILTSLWLQIILVFLATLRKRSRSNILVVLLWFAYLLADSTAIFCIGLICTKFADEGDDKPILGVNDFLLAFWAPFLLLHLGGPDTITAFAMEDNALWLRHLLGLIVLNLEKHEEHTSNMVLALALVSLRGMNDEHNTKSVGLRRMNDMHDKESEFGIIKDSNKFCGLGNRILDSGLSDKSMSNRLCAFLLTLPENTLWLPTALVFMAGIIKFAEKIRSLQLASASTTLQPIIRDPYLQKFLSNVHDPEERLMFVTSNGVEVLPDETVVRDAYAYFNIFKCLVVDAMLGQRERNIRQQFWFYQTAVDSLRIIEVELNLFYHAFYTKTSVICSKVGLSFRFLSVGSVVAALVLFTYDPKRGCNEFDVTVTYTLLYGAVALDIVSFLMLIFSDHSFTLFSSQNYDYDRSIGAIIHSTFSGFLKLRMKPSQGGGRGGRTMEIYEQAALLQKLWTFVFEELQRKSLRVGGVKDIQRICSYRGEWVIREEGILDEDDRNKLLRYVDSSKITFDQCLIVWHIATDLLFYEAEDERQKEKENLKKRSDDEIETRNGVDDVRQKNNIGNDPDLEQGSDDGVVPEEDLRDVSERNKENIPDVEKKYDDVELQHISKLLSDYLMYLLIVKPTMIPAMRGFGQKRFQETCDDAYRCAGKRLRTMDTCSKPHECIQKLINKENDSEKSEEQKAFNKIRYARTTGIINMVNPYEQLVPVGKCLLLDAYDLADVIMNLKGTNKWKMIAQALRSSFNLMGLLEMECDYFVSTG
ncbi:hypothetical protein Fmac_026441 [Flemingia macrophylla]|uniref:DUF4220 domain-containing protein n=1 Tax=Flemingia macrophylla TaxID=520843 RepID=A0ABD1LEV6_9FABA